MKLNVVVRAILIGLVCAPALSAQGDRPVVRDGDTTLIADVRSELQARYANLRPGIGLLVEANPMAIPGGSRTEIQSFREGDSVSRVVVSTWTGWGKYAVEYFLDASGELRFIFESGIYFDNAEARPQGRNFWGQPSWERRHYFAGGSIAATETTGDGSPPPDAAQVHAQRLRVLRNVLQEASRARQTARDADLRVAKSAV